MRKLIEGIIGMLASFGIACRPADVIWYYHIVWPSLLNHESDGLEMLPALEAPMEPSVWHYLLLIVAVVLFVFSVRSFIVGLKQVWIDTKTRFKGEELFGIVADVKSYMIGSPLQTAGVGVMKSDGSIEHFYTDLQLGEQYDEGDFLCVKHFEGDINVVRLAEATEVPAAVVQMLRYYPMFFKNGFAGEYAITGQETSELATVKINGKRYNTIFSYDADGSEGFYQGDSGSYYQQEDE